MDAIDTPGSVAGRFQNGNPALGTLGTVVGAKALNGFQEEPLNVIRAAGLVPSATEENQLLQAIQILTGGDVSTHALAMAAALGIGRVDHGRAGEPRAAITLLRQSGVWPAGTTPLAPTAGNTVGANEYAAGVYPGNAWPYMTIGARLLSTTAGSYPAAISGSGVNYYRNGGFFLEGGLLTNGAVLEVALSGQIMTDGTATRIVEVIVEPDFDPSAAFDATKAFAFQTGALADTSGVFVAFDILVRITCLGYDGTNWVFASTFLFIAGNDGAGAPQSFSRVVLLTVPSATVDFMLDQQFVIRFKTEEAGATIGAEGATSSDQTGAEITFNVNLAQVRLFPGEAA